VRALLLLVLLGGCEWQTTPLPAPHCVHPVTFADQPYCPTPIPTVQP
jgi:hypothetical protein